MVLRRTFFIACLVVGLAGNAARNASAEDFSGRTHTVERLFNRGAKTEERTAETTSGRIVLLDFYSDYCGPCQKMMPVVERLRSRGYTIQKINTMQNPALAQKMGVSRIPCFVVMVDGKEYTRSIGATSERSLEQMLVQAGKQAVPTERLVQNSETCEVTSNVAGDAKRSAWQGREVQVPIADIVNHREMFSLEKNTPPAVPTNDIASATVPVVPVALQAPAPAIVPSVPSVLNTPTASTAPTAPAPASVTPAVAGNATFPLESISGQTPTRSGAETSPDSESTLHSRVLASSVRINISLNAQDSLRQDCGTGTIIDSRSGRALILTCGHLFRDYKPGDKIEVDFFGDNGLQGIEARYIGHDLDSDLGLLSVPVSRPVQVTPVAPKKYMLQKGMRICTSGCSHGAVPTIQTGSVTNINRYLGSPNVEVSAVPVQGRSGGGAFSQDGYIIGVCIAAVPEDNEGMFSSVDAIHLYLEQMKLSQIACNPRNESVSVAVAAAPSASSSTMPDTMPDAEPVILLTDLPMKKEPTRTPVISIDHATTVPASIPAPTPLGTEAPAFAPTPAAPTAPATTPAAKAPTTVATAPSPDTAMAPATFQSLTGEPAPAWPPRW